MFSLGTLYLATLIVIIGISLVTLKRKGYLAAATKGAFGSLGALLAACFAYGLFNRFGFWHAASPAGVESGFIYALMGGIVAGPVVFIIGGLLSAAIAHQRKLK